MQRMGAKETQTEAEARARAEAELFFVLYCQCFVLALLKTFKSIQTMMFEYYNDDDTM